MVAWICTYKGFHGGEGTRGVSRSTTEAVVSSIVVLIIFDYLLTSIGVFK
jgi:phospholipid/cholesterol/gamma-HCH transport system permease protein